MSVRPDVRLLVATALLLGALPARAAPYERPLGVQRVVPEDRHDPVGEQRCTYYRDWMVRESGVDTPGPGPAELVVLTGAAPAAGCAAAPAARVLDTVGFSFLGRRGEYLVFTATDPNGAVDFRVLDGRDGARVFADASAPGSPPSADRLPAGLRLRYRRALNAPCSLVAAGETCWQTLLDSGRIPADLKDARPSITTCREGYAYPGVTPDSPTLVMYPVTVMAGGGAPPRVTRTGRVRCGVVP